MEKRIVTGTIEKEACKYSKQNTIAKSAGSVKMFFLISLAKITDING